MGLHLRNLALCIVSHAWVFISRLSCLGILLFELPRLALRADRLGLQYFSLEELTETPLAEGL
jgi:hypothetical protein